MTHITFDRIYCIFSKIDWTSWTTNWWHIFFIFQIPYWLLCTYVKVVFFQPCTTWTSIGSLSHYCWPRSLILDDRENEINKHQICIWWCNQSLYFFPSVIHRIIFQIGVGLDIYAYFSFKFCVFGVFGHH